MKDQKDLAPQVESQTYFEKLETATPAQVSQSVIAQIMQQLVNDPD